MAEPSASLPENTRRERFFAATDYHVIPGGWKKLEYIYALVGRLRRERPGLKVLDVGCGNGALTFAVAALGCDVLGVDVNAASVESARRASHYPNARFEAIPGSTFDLGATFDLIICSEVLEHLLEPEPLVATMARHLSPGGHLMITVPNGYGPREVLGRVEITLRRKLGLGRLIDRARASIGMLDHATKCAVHTSNPDQDHVQKFTRKQLGDILRRTGLSSVETVNALFLFGVIFRTKGGGIDRADGRLADFLPHWMASGWYLLCRKTA